MRPAKTQISLGIRPVWSESSLCAQWVANGPSFLHADSENSDQTGRMPRLIWVFAGRTLTLLVLSWGGSILPDLPGFKSTRFGINRFQAANRWNSLPEEARKITDYSFMTFIKGWGGTSLRCALCKWILILKFSFLHVCALDAFAYLLA